MNYFDCHADTLTEIKKPNHLWKNTNNLDLRRVRAFAEKYVQVFALWQDAKKCTTLETEAEFMSKYARMYQLLDTQADQIMLCRNGMELETAMRQQKAAAFFAIEDISLMGREVEHIRELGFSVAMLTWNYENAYAVGAVCDQQKGLTERGKELVGRLLDENIVLDVSHLSDAGVEELLEMTGRPFIASHSNARAVCENPRNLNDCQIKEIIRRKGLIGMNFYAPFLGSGETVELKELLCHMDHILNLGGEDVLAIGSDFDGGSNKFPVGITGVESIPQIKTEMKNAGFPPSIIEKIFFENAYRFFLEI